MDLTIFDVEHGACALLTCDNDQRMMIDCGHSTSTNWRPGDYLASLGVRYLDMLAITNFDEAHVSGLSNLTSKITIGAIARTASVSPEILMTLKSETGAGRGMRLLSGILRSLASVPQPILAGITYGAFSNAYPAFDDENNLSMAVHLMINGVGFLFPGGLESAGWKRLLAGHPGFRDAVKNTTVLVASHHGRESGICTELFDVYDCCPTVVVISDDHHQYDTQMTTAYYHSKCKGIPDFRERGNRRCVLTTRTDGAITFTFMPDGRFKVA